MSTLLPLAADQVETSDGSTVTVCEYAVPVTSNGLLRFRLVGEHVGTPADAYQWAEWALVSNAAGLAVVQAEGGLEEIDPAGIGTVGSLAVSVGLVQLQVTGVVGEDWRWAGSIQGADTVP